MKKSFLINNLKRQKKQVKYKKIARDYKNTIIPKVEWNKLQQLRRDLTDISSFIVKTRHSTDNMDVIDILYGYEKQVDNMRSEIFSFRKGE